MRRIDRKISDEETFSILTNGEYGILSTVSNGGKPYGIPLNYCVIENDIFFHCATKGKKLENFNASNNISFCVVGNTEVMPEKFETKYESAIIFGKVSEVFEKTKHDALVGLLKKYSPTYIKNGLKSIDKLNEKTKVFKIKIESMTGKACKK